MQAYAVSRIPFCQREQTGTSERVSRDIGGSLHTFEEDELARRQGVT